jgi:hypothetical protein
MNRPAACFALLFGTLLLSSFRWSQPARPELCACTICIQNRSSGSGGEPCGGVYDYDLAWQDDNGFQSLYSDGGASGEDAGETGCNPGEQPGDNYQVCFETWTDGVPAWNCTTKPQKTVDPADAEMSVDSCGDLSWFYYDAVDEGAGGNSLGNCPEQGCTTTDDFANEIAGEDSGATGYCNDSDCCELAAPQERK